MGNVAILSEMASCQMEYRYLAHLTGRPEYVRLVSPSSNLSISRFDADAAGPKVDRITEHMLEVEEHGGLYATTFDLRTGKPASNTYSVGALADSAYEYRLKEWLLTGRTEQRYHDMCT